MKKLLLVFLLLFPLVSMSQSAFVKTIDGMHFGRNTRIFQTNDQGIAVFSLDSLKLYKFNSCGNPDWAKQYKIPIGFYAGSAIKTRNGGFALLNRIPSANLYHSVVTLLDANGAIIWSRSLEDPDYIQYPYTISEDSNGNFVVLANASPLNQQGFFNTITKLDANGNFLWTKFYSFGPIWGGAIVTSDGGILARIGSTLFKIDQTGNLEWASGFGNTTSYLAPVEVSDGYIFTGLNSALNTVTFYKISKTGQLQLGGRKVTEFTGNPPQLYKKSNGNFAAVFNKTNTFGFSYATIIEFDKDLNIVRQSTLDNGKAGVILQGYHVGFSDENHTLLTGLTIANAAGSKLFFAKTDPLFHTGCDTTFAINITTEPVNPPFSPSSSVSSHTFSVVNKSFPVKNIPAITSTHCSSFAPARINIHADSILCANSPLALRDRSGLVLDSYLWSTGDTTATIAVNQSGKYWLRATTNCGAQTVSDTVMVTQIAFPQPTLTHDTALCQNSEVLINATLPGAVYRWHDGSTNAIYRATKPGIYHVDVTYQTCTKRFSGKIGDHEKLLLPNIFTPNNDGRNETFAPMEMCGVGSGKLKIYNRWGQLLYETSEINKGWNGRVNGQKTADGVYFYLLEYANFRNEQKMKKGWVELVGG
ncbi:gliding motility-associated C-terminal domain-containing protein [Adhaeribacter sp. BT258]|uniref:Gliding motility-associated C-terminal domain-containing protein n=1 Tax=Adhaeribacter terrigena TaxID=2793070 RepID=A0ABS1C557_9BACT|nr:gliding motility-associated C-terminal domain-containing protein [Adhaeribacter terrigena]MBK0404331.1 gliding motility-associated C-terminal domain-containing protein [Adhaeribacter terrigena]